MVVSCSMALLPPPTSPSKAKSPGSIDASTFSCPPPAGASSFDSLSSTPLNETSSKKNIPLANPTISSTPDDPMGPTLTWSEKIQGNSKLTNGIYGVTNHDGKTSIRRCALIAFPAGEDSFNWGDEASMISFIRGKMRPQSAPNKKLDKNGLVSGKANGALYTDESVSTTGHSITHQQLIEELQDSSKHF